MIPGTKDDWTHWLGERLGELSTGIHFLTRLPLPRHAPLGGGAVGQSVWAFPLAGFVVGLIGALVYALAHRLGLPPWPAAALAIAATLGVTGCLHEDGLADTADGFGGGDTTERKLDIMRDSRIGTYGVCALAVSLLLRTGAVASIAEPGMVAAALIAAHAAARATTPVVMFFVPPARRDGLSFAAGQPSAARVAIAAVLAVVILGLCLGPVLAVVAVIALAIAIALMAGLSERQIGGQTGDVLGAVEQISEIVILLVALR
jgi:adenosylcobinamide-GDP ribazoletransferase